MSDLSVLAFEVGDEGNCCGSTWLWEFEHSEHPIGDIAQTFLCHKFEYPAVGHLGTVFKAEDQWVFIFAAQQRVQFVQG